jgi:methylmalonyl-CoA mutase
MVAKMGQDGHDRGAKVVATAYADLGFDVDIGPFSRPRGNSSPGRRKRCPHRRHELPRRRPQDAPAETGRSAQGSHGREDILLVAGGVIPAQDYDAFTLRPAAIFGPGTIITESARKLLDLLEAQAF